VSNDDSQLPEMPPRESDGDSVERPEKRDRDYGWLLELLSSIGGFIADLLSGWH
jgi:hypothetical protein